MIRQTGSRGSREDWGSWKTICSFLAVPSDQTMRPSVGFTRRMSTWARVALAAAGLAHDAQGLALASGEVDAVEGMHQRGRAAQPVGSDREVDVHGVQGQDRGGVHGFSLAAQQAVRW